MVGHEAVSRYCNTMFCSVLLQQSEIHRVVISRLEYFHPSHTTLCHMVGSIWNNYSR